ncbi:c-type cytochrome [Algibacter luteus]|uniref:c-type cytochrome n=1 Tax=Algibacter luteus TaxID=1178825 RepID=UPI002593C2A0|nr:c-type cytochrome [Algibacter luteus]WJJ97899.1 c-type cytochrome [Algibacter luteus]
MKTKNLIFVLAISMLLFNCSSDSNDDVKEQEMNPDPTTITYSANIASIINNNCNQCHGSTPSNGAPFSLTTYDDVKNRVDRIIARVNNSTNPMPPSGQISSSLRDMIQQWKDDGLLEN